MVSKVLIGCDPELFVVKDGAFVSGHNMIPGTKDKPYKVPFGAVQVDGTALEFNIDPASSAEEFLHNVKAVQKELKKMLPKGYELVATPVARYDPKYFAEKIPEEAKKLGCDPDFNAWTGQMNEVPNSRDITFRTAAGHIHIGWTEDADVKNGDHFEDCQMMAKQLDYTLGMYSCLWDKDNTRRNLYGKAGAFRPKPYGVEYRVLSNMWLNSDALTKWVFNTAERSFQKLLSGYSFEEDYRDNAVYNINSSMTGWKYNRYAFRKLKKDQLPLKYKLKNTPLVA